MTQFYACCKNAILLIKKARKALTFLLRVGVHRRGGTAGSHVVHGQHLEAVRGAGVQVADHGPRLRLGHSGLRGRRLGCKITTQRKHVFRHRVRTGAAQAPGLRTQF